MSVIFVVSFLLLFGLLIWGYFQSVEKWDYPGVRYDPEIVALSGGMASHSTFPVDTSPYMGYVNYPYYPRWGSSFWYPRYRRRRPPIWGYWPRAYHQPYGRVFYRH